MSLAYLLPLAPDHYNRVGLQSFDGELEIGEDDCQLLQSFGREIRTEALGIGNDYNTTLSLPVVESA